MPNPWGGSNTDRDYAPHMYVLRVGGDPEEDSDYVFVGNFSGSAAVGDFRYKLGVDQDNELACDRFQLQDGSKYNPVLGTTEGVAVDQVPTEVVYDALKEGTQQSDQGLLAGMGVHIDRLPEFPVDHERLFNGTPDEQAAEIKQREMNQRVLAVVMAEVDMLWKQYDLPKPE